MLKTSFYSQEELDCMGFSSIGKNVFISRKASFYDIENIAIGNNVRIDDFCVLSGNVKIGNYIHISAYTGIWAGKRGVILEDFVTISGRCNVYGKTDDYSGEYMTNPMVPEKYLNVMDDKIIFRKHSIVGSACTILPGIEIAEGTAIGCMSLIKSNTIPWKVYTGIPAKILKDRDRKILTLETDFTLSSNKEG